MNICDIMSKQVISIAEDEPISAAAKLMKRCNLGALPVHDSRGHLKGIVTDRDIVLRCVAAQEDDRCRTVGEIMTRGLVSVSPFESVDNAIKRMSNNQVRRLPVTDNGILVGVVALCDLARNGDFSMETADALSEISANFRKN